MNCSLPGSSAHGIFQARILEWAHWSGPFPTLGDLHDPGIQLTSPALAGGFFTTEPPGKPKRRLTKGEITGLRKKKTNYTLYVNQLHLRRTIYTLSLAILG